MIARHLARVWVCLLLCLGVAHAEARWVVLGGALVEGVFALGGGAQVVGIDDSAQSLPGVGPLPAVGYYRQFSAEGVLALKPTRVVLPDTAGPAAALAQLAAAGVPVSVLPGGHGLESARVRVRELGALLGQKAKADQVLADMDAAVVEVAARADRARSKGRAPPRVLFAFVHGGNRLQLAGADTAAADMLRLVGAENALQGRSGYAPLAAESVVVARPEVWVTTTRSLAAAGGRDGLLKQPGVALTPAGKNGRLVVLDDHRLLGFGPHLGEALRALSAALYPAVD